MIIHPLDDDRRRDLHGDLEAGRRGIAGRQAVEDVLLQPGVARRQDALIAIGLAALRHGQGLIHRLAVGGGGQHGEGFAVAESAGLGGHFDVIAVEGRRSPGRTFCNVTRVGAGIEAQGQSTRAADSSGFFGEIANRGERPRPHRPGNSSGGGPAPGPPRPRCVPATSRPPPAAPRHDRPRAAPPGDAAPQEEEIDQAVLERRPALLERLGGEDRIKTRWDQGRQHETAKRRPWQAASHTRPKQKSSRPMKPRPPSRTQWSTTAQREQEGQASGHEGHQNRWPRRPL